MLNSFHTQPPLLARHKCRVPAVQMRLQITEQDHSAALCGARHGPVAALRFVEIIHGSDDILVLASLLFVFAGDVKA